MKFFCCDDSDEPMRIGVEAVSNVDLEAIDSRITHSCGWQESYPARTEITVLRKFAEEIIAKLKSINGITSVDGQLTERGVAVQRRFAR